MQGAQTPMLAMSGCGFVPLQAEDIRTLNQSSTVQLCNISVAQQIGARPMQKLILGIATLTIATAAGAFGPSERRAKELAAWTPAGDAVSCIETSRIDTTKILANNVIDFKMRGGKVYRNTLPHNCSGLVSEDRFSYRNTAGRLCSVDIIRVLHSYGGQLDEGVGCGLGKFQPMEKSAELENASYVEQPWAPFEVVDANSATN
jgi:hypothetical protein